MDTTRASNQKITLEIMLYAIMFLFFFQLVTDFFEATYAFGLMGLSFPVESLSLLLLFSPLVLLFWRRMPYRFAIWLAQLMLVTRIFSVLLDTRGKMIASGLGVGCFLLFFPAFLSYQQPSWNHRRSLRLGSGLLVGIMLSILFRELYSGIDITGVGLYRLIPCLLAVMGMYGFWRLFENNQPRSRQADRPGVHNVRFGAVLARILGIFSIWTLLYFSITSPNVIARWSGVNLLWIVIPLVVSFSLFAYVLVSRADLLRQVSSTILMYLNIIFVLSMVLTILANQVSFPGVSSSFPVWQQSISTWGFVPLLVMLFLAPVLVMDFIVAVRWIIQSSPDQRSLGSSFALGSIFFLLVVLAQVFTTVYDYIPLVGPFFRNKFWFVFLIPGLGLFLPFLNLPKRVTMEKSMPGSAVLMLGVLAIGLAAIGGVTFRAAQPAPVGDQNSLRILNYNVQQGYSERGIKDFQAQLEVIRSANADIIGLQETDTNRIAGGNTDIVRFFADELNMYSYYGPRTITGTFGVALLSRYPIINPLTFFMYSQAEQTATIQAQINVGGQTFNVFVTHLGNGGPLIQQQQVLQVARDLENVILLGDFNFRPDTQQYALTIQSLADSWLLTENPPKSGQDVDPAGRIEHIFTSSDMQVSYSSYLVSPASDHPAELSQIDW
jgi:endonuclease/exonuclease/phosphatase family metal-dependent hydrolase